jgi:phospholipid transport system substrate-binding protein
MTSESHFTRRDAMALGGSSLAAMVLPATAFALTTRQAESLIQKVVNETLSIANSNLSQSAALDKFEDMFVQYGDVPVIARAVLGAPWRTASSAQQQAFIKAFQGYLARKYGSEFREYRGSKITITGSSDQGDKGIVVNSMVETPGSAPFAVDYQVSDRSGSPKMFNIFIEGVSMLSTERSEIRAILESNRNSVDALIEDLKRRG